MDIQEVVPSTVMEATMEEMEIVIVVVIMVVMEQRGEDLTTFVLDNFILSPGDGGHLLGDGGGRGAGVRCLKLRGWWWR